MAEVSLIPKKITAGVSADGFGIFFRVAVVFFIVTFGIIGGLFLYRMLLESNLAKGQEALQALESQFPIETIEQHEQVGNAIVASNKILDEHLKQSSIFTLLEENTLPATYYSSFSYAENDRKATLTGEAPSYQAVAQQASVFEGLDKVSSATFSNLSLSSKGTVGFGLSIVFKDSFR